MQRDTALRDRQLRHKIKTFKWRNSKKSEENDTKLSQQNLIAKLEIVCGAQITPEAFQGSQNYRKSSFELQLFRLLPE